MDSPVVEKSYQSRSAAQRTELVLLAYEMERASEFEHLRRLLTGWTFVAAVLLALYVPVSDAESS